MTLLKKLLHTPKASILLAGIAGTTAMTAFSYFVANKRGKYFREPEILNDLFYGKLQVVLENVKNGRTPLAGHLAHFGVGTIFSMCYHLLWDHNNKGDAVKNGLKFGFVFGLLGIASWRTVFKLHPNAPVGVHVRDYLTHLLVAHLIYGQGVALTAALASPKHHESDNADVVKFLEDIETVLRRELRE